VQVTGDQGEDQQGMILGNQKETRRCCQCLQTKRKRGDSVFVKSMKSMLMNSRRKELKRMKLQKNEAEFNEIEKMEVGMTEFCCGFGCL
jgi:hypothetical protein